MHTKDNYGWLDCFRLFASLLVIAIHTSPLGAFSPEGDFFLTRVLARIAVPFFFMVTGQFVAEKMIATNNKLNDISTSASGTCHKSPPHMSASDQNGHQLCLRCLRKNLVLYAISIILYLPVGVYAGHYQKLTLASLLKMLFFDGTFYHLWYFPACLLGILLVYLMSRFLNLRGILTVSMGLYIIGLLGDSYFGFVQRMPWLETIYEFFFQICSYTRNGLFFAPLFLALGAWCARNSRRGMTVHLTTLILSLLLMTVEAFTLRRFSWQRHDSMYIMLVPVMISLYRLLLCLPGSCEKTGKRFRSASLWIYVLHPAFIIAVRGIAKVLHLTPLLVDNSLVHYLAVSILSVSAGFGIPLLAEPVRIFCGKTRGMIHKAENHDNPYSQQTASPGQTYEISRRPDTKKDTDRIQMAKERIGKLPMPYSSLYGRAWIELSKTALAQNVEYLRSLMPADCRLMPAVKANAYGHGAVWTATELNRLGVDSFCVACISEGIALRKAKIKGEILILGYTAPENFALLTHHKLTQTVIDYKYAQKLADAGIMLHVHIGIDTGMHRLGIRCEDIEDILAVFEMRNLVIDGLFTHLCACDSLLPEHKIFTEDQIQAFYRVVEILEEQGIPCPKLHLQSSYGLLNYPGLDADYVRAGIALYGIPGSIEDVNFDGHTDFFRNLSPVLSLKARVVSVRTLYAGDSAGYGLAFTAEKDMPIAVLSIGYADGLPRELSCGKGHVLLHGFKAPIIGRICMDQTLVDISGIPKVSAGDIAVLIGISGEEEITAAQLASQCGTITNELLSRLGERLERIEKKD